MEEEELDFTKLKYVLYARKSTDDPQRQIRSIDDQIYDCQLVQSRLGLNVVAILRETKSAKKPNQRPVFSQMLKDLRDCKYDGILAWNPDRLARNMKEGGEIIDMIDEEQIKDLKFVTHHFSKDANGKMLLGMAFVLSKQYSDDLSQKVTRGVRRKFSEGKTQVPKHGYLNEEGFYKPDGKNFELICTAWNMRSEGTAIEVIATYMNGKGYTKIVKRSGKAIKITTQMLSDLFKDPFYYGVLVQANQKVDLREMYNFDQATTEEIYNKVQELSFRRIKPNIPHKTAFYPLRAMIICSFCGGNMYVAPSSGNTKRYLNARCDNKSCSRSKRSIRMIRVFEFIYEFLGRGLNFSEKEYDDYYGNLTKLSDQMRTRLKVDIHSKQGVLKGIEREIRETSLGMLKLKEGSTPLQVAENRVNELSEQEIELEEAIKKLQTKITNPEDDRLSVEQFLNLSKNAAKIVKSAGPIVKDYICKKIFLNLTVDEEKVLSYQLKEPFATLLKVRHKSFSRDAGN